MARATAAYDRDLVFAILGVYDFILDVAGYSWVGVRDAEERGTDEVSGVVDEVFRWWWLVCTQDVLGTALDDLHDMFALRSLCLTL